MKKIAEFYTDNHDLINIYEDGDIYVNGQFHSQIYPDGEIWIYGKKIAKVYEDGDIWSNGKKIGKIYSDGEIWCDGKKIAQGSVNNSSITDTRPLQKPSTEETNSFSSKNNSLHSNNNFITTSSGGNIGLIIALIAIIALVICSAIYVSFIYWFGGMFESVSTKDFAEKMTVVLIYVLAFISIIIHYYLNIHLNKKINGYIIHVISLFIGMLLTFIIVKDFSLVALIIVPLCLAIVPTLISYSIIFIVRKIKHL